MKILYLILSIIGGIFLVVFLMGFIGAWIISAKRKSPGYSGPVTSGGLLFWIVFQIVRLIQKLKSFLSGHKNE